MSLKNINLMACRRFVRDQLPRWLAQVRAPDSRTREFLGSDMETTWKSFLAYQPQLSGVRGAAGGVWVFLQNGSVESDGNGIYFLRPMIRARVAVRQLEQDKGKMEQAWSDYAGAVLEAAIDFPYGNDAAKTFGSSFDQTDSCDKANAEGGAETRRFVVPEQDNNGMYVFDVFYEPLIYTGDQP